LFSLRIKTALKMLGCCCLILFGPHAGWVGAARRFTTRGGANDKQGFLRHHHSGGFLFPAATNFSRWCAGSRTLAFFARSFSWQAKVKLRLPPQFLTYVLCL
jgi:hypothetical protein